MKNLLLLFCMAMLCAGAKAQTNLYVDSSVTASGAGTSWATSYKTLNEALNVANPASTTTQYIINVAKGTYWPTGLQSGTSRDSAFGILRGGVKLLGGYPTGGGVRDYVNFPTILSGNINSVTDSVDNCYHVMVMSNISATSDSVIVDGFTVTRGYANGTGTKAYNGINCNRAYGAGIYNTTTSAKVKIVNANITGNFANTYGGGIYIRSGAPSIGNTAFTLNRVTSFGGAVFCDISSLYLADCNVSGNIRTAIYFDGSATNGEIFSCTGSTFANNQFGAVYFYGNTASSSISNSTFIGNINNSNGGAIYLSSGLLIASCSFTSNIATTGSGGAVHGAGTMQQCTFTNNQSNLIGGAVYSTGTVTGCTFSGNKCPASGGAVYSTNIVSNSTMTADTAYYGGGIFCEGCSITNCNVNNNRSTYGGGVFVYTASTINNTRISGNSAQANGGGMYVGGSSTYTYTLRNTLIAGNAAGSNGGALYCRNLSTSSTFTNITLAGNNAVSGLALYDSTASPTILNSIIYNGANSIFNIVNSTPGITYSDVEGGYTGTGNINADPKFVNPITTTSAPTTTGNYSLLGCSPGVNAGFNSGSYTGVTDAAGNPRLFGGTVDMGAYEFQAAGTGPGPITGNSTVCVNATLQLGNTNTTGVWSSGDVNIATVSATGLVTGVAAGTVTISYLVNGSTSCASTVTKVITVNAIPVVNAITGNNSFCQAATSQLSITSTGGSWSSSATSIATVNASSGLVTGVAGGTATISYTIIGTNGCANAATYPVTVNPLPTVPAITGITSVCANATTLFSNTTPGGVWSSLNTAVATVSATGLVTGVAPGSTTISYTVTSSFGCARTVTRNVTVSAAPVVAAITGGSTMCVSSTLQLSNPTTGNSSWSSSNNNIAIVNNLGLVTSFAAGVDTIFYSIQGSNGCVTSVYKEITVNPLPVVPPITGPATVCNKSTIQLSNTLAGGTWSSFDPDIQLSSSGQVKGVALGFASVDYSYTDINGCIGSANAVVQVLGPNVAVTQNENTLTSAAASATYQWVTCPAYAAVAGATSQSFTATANGQYAAIVTSAGCTDTSICYTISKVGVREAGAVFGTFEVFPNPTRNTVSVLTSTVIPDVIRLLDITGRELQRITPAANQTKVSLSGYPAGIYQIEVIKGNDKQTKKLSIY